MIWYLTPGRSFTLPPLISTIECSCRLCPTPGIYAVTSIPFVRRTLATFLNAELGFLGVVVYTLTHTPLRWGQDFKAGLFVFFSTCFLPCLINWAIVGMFLLKIRLKFVRISGSYLLPMFKGKLGNFIRENIFCQEAFGKNIFLFLPDEIKMISLMN
jgi:hypothetical protein